MTDTADDQCVKHDVGGCDVCGPDWLAIIRDVAVELRSEASIASRTGQFARLDRLADLLAESAAGLSVSAARIAQLEAAHQIAHYDGQSLEAVCSCGTVIGSVYGTTTTYAQLFARHLRERKEQHG